MTRPDEPAREEDFGALLAAYDEALAYGAVQNTPSPADPTLRQRLEKVRGCLVRLQRAFPRADGKGDGPPTVPYGPALVGGAAFEPPRHLGRFRILCELGRGGFGIVYLAHDPRLRRDVALKVPRPDVLVTSDLRQRFRTEAESAAKLDHPNLIPVHDAGDEPFCYLVSAFCPGPTLAAWLRKRQQPVPSRQAARLVAALADAVEYMHGRGILHRDIKPSNILLQPRETDPATADADDLGFTPRLTDFGLAKAFEGLGDPTRTGTQLGTPGYMAPEQASESRGAVGRCSDVYALGVVLYELLTGRPPFQATDPVETLRLVLDAEPVPPRRLEPSLPRDLETVCLKCLRKEAGKRYESAGALANDLRNFLEGRPTQARPVGRVERLARWGRKNKPLAIAGALGGVAALVAVCLFVAFTIRHAHDLKETRLQRATLTFEQGQKLCEEGDVNGGLLLLAHSLQLAPDDATDLQRVIRTNLAAWQEEACALRLILPPEKRERVTALSPDGKVLFVADAAGPGRFWMVATRTELHPLQEQTPGIVVGSFSPDGRQLLTGTKDGTAELWDVATGARLRVLRKFAAEVRRLSFRPDGKSVAIGLSNESVHWCVLAPGEELALPAGLRSSHQLCWSPDGNLLLADHPDQFVAVWDLVRGKESSRLEWPDSSTKAIRAAAFSPDGRTILTGTRDHTSARLWEAGTGKELHRFEGRQGSVWAVGFGDEGRTILVARSDRTVHSYDVQFRKPIRPPLKLPETVTQVALSTDGNLIQTVHQDGSIRLWEPASQGTLCLAEETHDIIIQVTTSPDGRTVLTVPMVSAGRRGHAQLWDLATGKSLVKLPDAQSVWSAAFSPDGTKVLTGGGDGTACLWDAASGVRLQVFSGHTNTVCAVAFSPNGQIVFTASLDGSARAWEATTGRLLFPPILHGEAIYSLAVSRDGLLFVTGSKDGSAQVWEADTGAPHAQRLQHDGAVQAVAFSPDGKFVLTGSRDHTAQIWDGATGKPVGDRLDHQDAVWAVAFSPDGKVVATASWDHTAQLWDARTGQPLGRPLQHDNHVYAVAFSPDGKTLLTGSLDKTARLWDTGMSRALGPPLRHTRGVRVGAFNSDGQICLTGSMDGTTRIWKTPQPLPDSPETVRLWAESLAGARLDEAGKVQLLDTAEWLDKRQRVQERGGPGGP